MMTKVKKIIVTVIITVDVHVAKLLYKFLWDRYSWYPEDIELVAWLLRKRIKSKKVKKSFFMTLKNRLKNESRIRYYLLMTLCCCIAEQANRVLGRELVLIDPDPVEAEKDPDYRDYYAFGGNCMYEVFVPIVDEKHVKKFLERTNISIEDKRVVETALNFSSYIREYSLKKHVSKVDPFLENFTGSILLKYFH